MENYSQLMSQFLWLDFKLKPYGVKGETPLRDRRGRRLPPYLGHIALLISPAILTPRRYRHHQLELPASIVQLIGTVQAIILLWEVYLISTTCQLRRHVLECNQIKSVKLSVRLIKAWGTRREIFKNRWRKKTVSPGLLITTTKPPKGGKGGNEGYPAQFEHVS